MFHICIAYGQINIWYLSNKPFSDLYLVAGKPLPRVIWYRNGRTFPSKSESWTTTNSRYHDSRDDDSFFSTRPYKGSSPISEIGDNQIKLTRRKTMTTYANITIESLSREDVQTELTCQASNFQATILRTSVEIDMKCKCYKSKMETYFKQHKIRFVLSRMRMYDIDLIE